MNCKNTTEDDAAVASFHDDPLEVVRVIAGLAAQYASMTEAERRGQPSPVRPDSPMAQAAIRICRLHGYADDGNELPGFMERAARAELAANPTKELRALQEAMTPSAEQIEQREAFRKWYCDTFHYRPQDMSDSYMLGTTAWKAWCEATSRALKGAAS